jgi:hypothetical protein
MNAMDRPVSFTEQRVFHATGRREGDGVAAIDALGLAPAALAPYRDLARLRHDFPVVLARDDRGPGRSSRSRRLVDRVLRELAPKGMAGERLRKPRVAPRARDPHAFARGRARSLSALWDEAAASGRAPARRRRGSAALHRRRAEGRRR